ncbi:cysteine dioxygenase [Amycolatopsis nigrescens]|uniref:cysteine dioxygenase n=1 Tax=Amycolatopsis nigrescens TaxID=381445 RepID=UPI001469D58E|nr:cysteine dioxygenase family protein [Amycolatopsis nigrescens]
MQTLRTLNLSRAGLCPRPEDFEASAQGRRVRPAALRRTVSEIAARPELWSGQVRFDLTERYFTRLHRDDDFEIWLICWELGQDTLLHDHGGSVGAFSVASGNLVEDHGDLRGDGLRTRAHRAGDSVAFGPEYLHNLVNIATEPAVTVHAYSRPLSRMNFYCWLPSGPHHLREIPCDNPEPDTGDLEAAAARTRAAHQ